MANFYHDNVYYIEQSAGTAVTNWRSACSRRNFACDRVKSPRFSCGNRRRYQIPCVNSRGAVNEARKLSSPKFAPPLSALAERPQPAPLSPTLHPWYLTWALPFLACFPSRAWTWLLALAPLCYSVVARWQLEGLWQEPAWLWPLWALPFLALLLRERLRRP